MKDLESYEPGTCFITSEDGVKAVPAKGFDSVNQIIAAISTELRLMTESVDLDVATIKVGIQVGGKVNLITFSNLKR